MVLKLNVPLNILNMKYYKLNVECESKDTIEAIKQYIFNHFEGVTTIESSEEAEEAISHIGSRSHTVLRTTRKA